MPRLLLLAAAVSSAACNAGALTPLSAAARRGDLVAMRRLLEAGADPNDRGPRGSMWPPLMHAVHEGQIEAVRLLLDYGADPDSGGPHGYTALMMAAADRDPSIVSLLLDRGAAPHRVGPGGITARGEAVTGGAGRGIDRPIGGCHPDTVRVLLDRVPELQLPGGAAGDEAQFWIRLHAGLQKMRNIAVVPATGTPPQIACGTVMAMARSQKR